MTSIFLLSALLTTALSTGTSEALPNTPGASPTPGPAPWQPPKSINIEPARYPPAQLRSCKGGTVEFTVTIAEDGRVYDVQVLSSPGQEFSDVVVATIKKRWRFAPYQVETGKALVRFKSHMNFNPDC